MIANIRLSSQVKSLIASTRLMFLVTASILLGAISPWSSPDGSLLDCPLLEDLLPEHLLGPQLAAADSGLDLLSQFDQQRVADCYPVNNSDQVSEIGKLLFRLQAASKEDFTKRSAPLTTTSQSGDITSVTGQISAIKRYKIPAEIAPYIEMDQFDQYELAADASSDPSIKQLVFAAPIKAKVSKGDRFSADAMLIHSTADVKVFAARSFTWTPHKPDNVGWQMLSQQGVDLSLLSEIQQIGAKPLTAKDADLFYNMIRAADAVATEQPAAPAITELAELLKSPKELSGHWIRMPVSVVRITKVMIDSAARRDEMGQDCYYQIDSVSDLGKVVVQIPRPKGDPIKLSGRYPVSIVSKTLPEFLKADVDEGRTVTTLDSPAFVNAFFYRLWSFDNQFMTEQAAGKQVAPLLIASKMDPRPSPKVNKDSVNALGYFMFSMVLLIVIGTVFWTWTNQRKDKRVRDRLEKETKIEIPSES